MARQSLKIWSINLTKLYKILKKNQNFFLNKILSSSFFVLSGWPNLRFSKELKKILFLSDGDLKDLTKRINSSLPQIFYFEKNLWQKIFKFFILMKSKVFFTLAQGKKITFAAASGNSHFYLDFKFNVNLKKLTKKIIMRECFHHFISLIQILEFIDLKRRHSFTWRE